jgi:hypothetical protein
VNTGLARKFYQFIHQRPVIHMRLAYVRRQRLSPRQSIPKNQAPMTYLPYQYPPNPVSITDPDPHETMLFANWVTGHSHIFIDAILL